MIVSLFPYLENSNSLKVTVDVINELKILNCDIIIDEMCHEKLGAEYTYLDTEELVKQCDICIAIGGDGTTLRVAKKAAIYNKDVLSINAGRLGFMSSIEKNELHLLSNVINGDYSVEKRMMLKVEVTDNDKVIETLHCLNDAVITRGNFTRLIDINISSDMRSAWNVRADGVIVSTPTGSTAYSMAAGGPVVSPDADCFIVTSICPHSLIDRSIIFPCEKNLYLKVANDLDNDSVLTADGKCPVPITSKNLVRVTRSEYTARLIKVKPDNFYEVIKKKIIERQD